MCGIFDLLSSPVSSQNMDTRTMMELLLQAKVRRYPTMDMPLPFQTTPRLRRSLYLLSQHPRDRTKQAMARQHWHMRLIRQLH